MKTSFDKIWVVVSGYTGNSECMLEMHLAEFGCQVSEDLLPSDPLSGTGSHLQLLMMGRPKKPCYSMTYFPDYRSLDEEWSCDLNWVSHSLSLGA